MAEGERIPRLSQEELTALASSLDIRYAVLDNLCDGHATYRAMLTLHNKGSQDLTYNNWTLYFSHIRKIEPDQMSDEDGVMISEGLCLTHVNGWLFLLRPTKDFPPLAPGKILTIPFKGQYYSVARTDVLPNWYLASDGLEPVVIASTAGESLDFVAPFDAPSKWKRFDYVLRDTNKRRYDFYDPFTPEVRFEKNVVDSAMKDQTLTVIPTPVEMIVDSTVEGVAFKGAEWSIYYDPSFSCEAGYLAKKLSARACYLSEAPHTLPLTSRKSVILSKCKVEVWSGSKHQCSKESYQLTVDPESEKVSICANDGAGAFYGVQTFLSLAAAAAGSDAASASLPKVEVRDTPRFPHRGMHVDVSRNFHGKETVLRLLEVMGMYKLNKFHFHLTDDEGWRLQIPGLEELTQVGSNRGHATSEGQRLLPVLGSGPHSTGPGSGFFSIQDYQEILTFAVERHIEVIPEVDMPGHCHAAVQTMKARYHKLKAAGDTSGAEQYLLSDLSVSPPAQGHCRSVQMFSENSLNPGLPSTYEFIRKVMMEIKAMHQAVSPLRMFHFGGDEVPYEAWEDSPACQELVSRGEVEGFRDLMQYFVSKVAAIAGDLALDVGAWQDGIVHKSAPFPRQIFPSKTVTVNAWKNVWETGTASDVYKLANCGYQVVLSLGTHLYFDHPQEPDPEERGLYWGCRYCDTAKVFGFAPDNLFSNACTRLTGEPFSAKDLKALLEDEQFVPLERHGNIIGVQGQLWTELIRTPEQFDSMVYPRLLSLAERAWHRASWEDLQRDDEKRRVTMQDDWARFSWCLGCKELKRLEELAVKYYLPPPGARVRDQRYLEVNCQIAGLPVQYAVDSNQQEWMTYSQPLDWGCIKDVVSLRTCSLDRSRHSRIITFHKTGQQDIDAQSQ